MGLSRRRESSEDSPRPPHSHQREGLGEAVLLSYELIHLPDEPAGVLRQIPYGRRILNSYNRKMNSECELKKIPLCSPRPLRFKKRAELRPEILSVIEPGNGFRISNFNLPLCSLRLR